MMNVYFDNAATTPVHPKVFEAMLPYLKEDYGNPSSIHASGRKIRVAVEEARGKVAEFINADASEIYFVSSGTEANNFPLFGIAQTEFDESGRNHIITSQAEHKCILDSCQYLDDLGFLVDYVEVKEDSTVDKSIVRSSVRDSTSLISLIHINNETGAINPIKDIAEFARRNDMFIHTDAVQSFGKTPIDVKDLGVDALSASLHKFYGPKGIGIVYVKSGTPLQPMIFGGSQERNRRGGTENVPGIIGAAKAIEIAKNEMSENEKKMEELKSHFIKDLKDINNGSIKINGGSNTSPYLISVSFDSNYYQNDAESMLMFLDLNGIAASNGAACTSGTLNPSHVIMSMGNSREYADGTIRFSFGPQNTTEEVDYTLDVLQKMMKKFRVS